MNVDGKVALITGASSGIGLATAQLLHSRGAKVALVARSRDALERHAVDLGHDAVALPCDVSDVAALAPLVDNVIAELGGIDILVNNAGLHLRGSMLRHPPEGLAAMFAVNTIAPVVLTRICADQMPPGSCVVNVASLAGKLPVPGSATYSGTKAGLRFWAIAAAEDLAPRGIRIANVNPGPVDSGFFDGDVENVSPLTFSQPMSTMQQCAQAVLRCVESDASPMEIDLPYASGKLATMGYALPWVRSALRPVLQWRGERAKAAFIERSSR